MAGKVIKEAGINPFRRLVKAYIALTAGALASLGLFLLSTWWATRNSIDRWFAMPDPLSGLSKHTLLALVGLLHIGASGYLFAGRNLMHRNLAVLWLGLAHLNYYVALYAVDSRVLLETEHFIGWRTGLQSSAVDVVWRILWSSLIGSGALSLLVMWCRSKRQKRDAWIKQWMSRQDMQLKRKSVGSERTPIAKDYTRIICFTCGQKIAFPSSRLGERISCPHCGCPILLCRQPAPEVS